MKMNKPLARDQVFEFIRRSPGVHEILGEEHIAGIAEFKVCPVSNVPRDGAAYLTFIGRTAKAPLVLLEQTSADLVVVDAGIAVPDGLGCCIVRVENARLFFCELLSFSGSTHNASISPHASIHPAAKIGEGCSIGDFVCIAEGVEIGDACVIASNVSISRDVKIGNRVNIAAGVVIGSDGFGYERREDGSLIKFPHLGGVLIGDDVDIGGNTVIDRGTLGNTVIERGVKIDNLVHISHNVHIEQDVVVIANAMIAGGVRLGREAWVGPSTNVLDQTAVGSKSFLGMGVSVISSLPEGSRFTLKHFFRGFSKD